jgi:PTH2 family peptidyl-tRNA hydrolase
VLIERADLGRGRGKVVAQCAHAALAAGGAVAGADAARRGAAWRAAGGATVVLRCESEAGLLELGAAARARGLAAALVRDAGRTLVAAGTATVLAVGPGAADAIDAVTGHLRLL